MRLGVGTIVVVFGSLFSSLGQSFAATNELVHEVITSIESIPLPPPRVAGQAERSELPLVWSGDTSFHRTNMEEEAQVRRVIANQYLQESLKRALRRVVERPAFESVQRAEQVVAQVREQRLVFSPETAEENPDPVFLVWGYDLLEDRAQLEWGASQWRLGIRVADIAGHFTAARTIATHGYLSAQSPSLGLGGLTQFTSQDSRFTFQVTQTLTEHWRAVAEAHLYTEDRGRPFAQVMVQYSGPLPFAQLL